MFAIDTNLLVYAHNTASPYHTQAKAFVEAVMNTRDEDGNLSVCLPAQVLMEFVHVITWQHLEAPLSLSAAIQVVQDYRDTGVAIISHQETQIQTFLALLTTLSTRKKVFDVALAATLKDNGITRLYTVNTADFEEFEFLEVTNPLQEGEASC